MYSPGGRIFSQETHRKACWCHKYNYRTNFHEYHRDDIQQKQRSELLYDELGCMHTWTYILSCFYFPSKKAWLQNEMKFPLIHIYLSSAYYLPGTVLGTGDAIERPAGQRLGELRVCWGRPTSTRNRRKRKVENCRNSGNTYNEGEGLTVVQGVKAPWERRSWEGKDEQKLATSTWLIWILQHASRKKAQ